MDAQEHVMPTPLDAPSVHSRAMYRLRELRSVHTPSPQSASGETVGLAH